MRPRAFCEFPAGLAAVSLRLHGGANCRPPISRMGNKAGYSQVILAALGLTSGQGASAYLWAEADPDVRGLLRAYPDADLLRRVAEIIRGWADEEPRALWERLRGERKARGVQEGAEATAGWIIDSTWSRGSLAGQGGFNDTKALGCEWHASNGDVGYYQPQTAEKLGERCHRLAEYALLADGAFRQGEPESGFRDDVRQAARGNRGEPAHNADRLQERFEGMAREVAEHAWFQHQAFRRRPIFERDGEFWSIANPLGAKRGGLMQRVQRRECHDPEEIAQAIEGCAFCAGQGWAYSEGLECPECRGAPAGLANVGGWPPVAILSAIPAAHTLAEWLGTPLDLRGVVVYMDPPYVGTTGYAHDFSRADVLWYAETYANLGATVAISEAEPLNLPGWHAIEITEGRKGQKRTFSAQKREFLTMNREPAHKVATQPSLFGAA